MRPIVRFAPSPTGRLHIGNIRPAILNWLFAHATGGTFILRFDDTDAVRSREEFVTGIREDLAWLGLIWAREERQSARLERYALAAERLKVSGHLYPCFESQSELDRRRKRQLAAGRPPIYDRAALRLTEPERAELLAGGRKPHWRLRLPNGASGGGLEPQPTLLTWRDLIRGDQMVDIGSLSDPVLVREDGTPLYTFTSVVDDIEMGITHVIRGEDHVTNTGVQLALFKALGAPPPSFGHHGLLVSADGQALSKRLDALAIASFKEAGLEPLAVAAHAALIGTSDSIEPYATLDALAARFDCGKISTTPARFDETELRALNARHLHAMPYAAVSARLNAMGITGGEAFWNAVRANIGVLREAGDWWTVVRGPLSPQRENPAFLERAADLLPVLPWSEATWGDWTAAIKTATGVKGRALYHPLRMALTGRESGPELKVLLPLIGRQNALARLRSEAS